MESPTVIVFDLEFVQPNLQVKSGLIDRYGQFQVEKYQIYCSRIWQMAFVARISKFFEYVHPGIDVANLSPVSSKFLKSSDRMKLSELDPRDGLAAIWSKFTDWLTAVAGNSKHVILVAQQAQHNDEIVLSVEMARHGLEWPEGITVEAVDALPYIQQCFQEQNLERERSWTVSAVYKEFTGKSHHNAHNALADAECLLTNLKTCWGLRIMANLGFHCPYSTIQVLSSNVEKVDLFWDTAHKIFEWGPKPLRDNRQSIWALATSCRRNSDPWPRQLLDSLEKECEVYTVSDLVERDKQTDFRDFLKNHPQFDRYESLIVSELDYRQTQLFYRSNNAEMGLFGRSHANKSY